MNKMEAIKLISLLCFIFFLCACSNSDSNQGLSDDNVAEVENGYVPSGKAKLLDAEDYVEWIQDPGNGFRKEKTIADLTFSAQFKPFEYIVCLEEKKNEIADSVVRRKVSELNGMQYYDLKISLNASGRELLKHELTSTQQYQERVNYFAFGMQNDIQLIDGPDTLACELYHFERSYDASPATVILLGFPVSKHNTSGDKTLLLYDRTFNSGLLKFTFSKKELKNLPKLQTL
ncbi:MAG: hypothetical protein IPN33_22105 [Saprospiraceae bacterium]|nr:hypothetical protein [Saprospiraceae bacterium]